MVNPDIELIEIVHTSLEIIITLSEGESQKEYKILKYLTISPNGQLKKSFCSGKLDNQKPINCPLTLPEKYKNDSLII